ncbi:MAG: TylF/MycF/NovP-related O-methyltransferase [Phycisphaerales bacterium JB065]
MQLDQPDIWQDSPVVPEADFQSTYQRGLGVCGGTYHPIAAARFYNLVQALRMTEGLPGQTIEAGCYRGLTSYLTCHTLRQQNPSFDGTGHTVVDSFEGLSEPTEADGADAHACWSRGQFTDTGVDHLRRVLADFPNVRFCKGWIPAVLDELDHTPLRFAHIDVDLHDPTLQCLECFYPRLVPGGIIVIDDYGPWSSGKWEGCHKACATFAAGIPEPIVPLSTGNAMLIRRA